MPYTAAFLVLSGRMPTTASTPAKTVSPFAEKLGGLLAEGRPDLKWPFLPLAVLVMGIGFLPFLLGRHITLTLPVLAMAVSTQLWRGRSAALIVITLITVARLLVNVLDCDTEWSAEIWNLPMDFLAATATVAVLNYLAERERERCSLQAMVAVRESETRLRQVTQWSNIGLWDWVVGSAEIYYSPEWKRQLGYEPDELADRVEEWSKRLHPDDRERALNHLEDYQKGRVRTYNIEFRLQHRDGSWRWIQSIGDAFRDADGNPIRALGCHLDITERKQAEFCLAARERELREAQQVAGVGSFTLNVAAGTWTCSDEMRRVLGIGHDHPLTVASWAGIVHPDDRERMVHYFTAEVIGAHGTGVFDREYRIVRPSDQAVRWMRGRGLVEFSPTGEPLLMRGSIQDVSDRREAAEALEVAHARSVEAERATDRAVREERARVGRELHDGLAQQLASTGINSSLLARRMAAEGCEQAVHVQRIAMDLRSMVQRSRQLARGLLSEVVPGDALAERLLDLADETTRGGRLACSFSTEGELPLLTSEQATHLYLIAAEAVRNALAHAEAGRLVIELVASLQRLRLDISDDGRGPPDGPARADAMGQQIMAHRAALIGASFNFGPGLLRGSTVTCALPLPS